MIFDPLAAIAKLFGGDSARMNDGVRRNISGIIVGRLEKLSSAAVAQAIDVLPFGRPIDFQAATKQQTSDDVDTVSKIVFECSLFSIHRPPACFERAAATVRPLHRGQIGRRIKVPRSTVLLATLSASVGARQVFFSDPARRFVSIAIPNTYLHSGRQCTLLCAVHMTWCRSPRLQ